MANPTTNDDISTNPGGATKGDNRTNTDRDGNRAKGKAQPASIPDATREGIPSVGQGDGNKRNRDRGDGTKRVKTGSKTPETGIPERR